MIHKSTPVHACTMAMGIVIMSVALLLLPMPSAGAAGGVRPVVRPAVLTAPHASHIDPRIAEFNRELAAYKQTVAALRRDTERLMMQEKRLDALVSDINSSAQMDMINLQSLMSQRQTAVQLSTNIIKSLSDSADAIVHNIGK